jgi:hypothetical protein
LLDRLERCLHVIERDASPRWLAATGFDVDDTSVTALQYFVAWPTSRGAAAVDEQVKHDPPEPAARTPDLRRDTLTQGSLEGVLYQVVHIIAIVAQSLCESAKHWLCI